MAAEGNSWCRLWAISLARQWGRDRMAAEGRRSLGRARRIAGVNGAATGWPRKAQRTAANFFAPCRVNGAATGWPRKAPAARRAYSSLFASMGPRPDGRGRAMITRHSSAPSPWRQWGRDRMAAEGRRTPATARHCPHASMGPRPDGRGRCLVRASWISTTLPASMGPRPDGRGRTAYHMSGRTCTRGVNGAATGWPRKAEGTGVRAQAAPASMGPRPDGRGRSFREDKTFTEAERQWGRDRMAAEGRRWG